MKMKRKELMGVIPAVLTPFNEFGEIQYGLFEKQINYFIEAGVHGLFVGGTTAEGSLISRKERIELFQIAVNSTTEKHLRCVVIIEQSTKGVMEVIDTLDSKIPDYISVVPPYYLNLSQKDIIEHFVCIAEFSPCPIILYNIPQNTHNKMSLETILELSTHQNISGVKDSSGDFILFQRGLLTSDSKKFSWIMGECLLDAPAYLLGAKCIISGLSNVYVEPYIDMYTAYKEKDWDSVIRCQSQINQLANIIFMTGGKVIPAIKEATSLLGRCTPNMRMRSMDLTKEEKMVVKKIITDMKMI